MKFLLLFLFFISSNYFSYLQTENAYKIFLLGKTNNNIYLETVQIGEGVTKTFKQSDFITFIVPIGLGKSGDIIQATEKNSIINICCANGEIKVSIIDEAGSERYLPTVNYSDLQSYLIRVNVISGNGVKKAFYIKNYNEYGDDDGPVFDLFSGKIPLAAQDYSVTIEVGNPKDIKYVKGIADLEIYDNLLFLKGKLNDKTEGFFIIDFGAGRTIFSKEYIPQDNKISEIKSIQYSNEGVKISKGEIGAAGGNVPNLLGNTVIEKFYFGDLELTDLPITVVEKLPDIAGRKISGIIGVDILQMAPTVSIEYTYGKGGKIILNSELSPVSNYYKIPFLFINNQIFIKGKINDKEINFLFDTGARYSFVSDGLKLKTTNQEAPDVRGLDGDIIPSSVVGVKNFSLEQTEFEFKDFYSANLPVINNLGLEDSGALLGGNFLREFNIIIVDFVNKVIIIEK